MRGRESRRCSMEWAWALQTYFKSLAWRVAAFANVVGDRNKGRKDNAETLRCQSYTEKAEVTNLGRCYEATSHAALSRWRRGRRRRRPRRLRPSGRRRFFRRGNMLLGACRRRRE